MTFQRSSGLLLHPTSLPGSCGIGELGREAIRFLDFLAEAGQRLWQVLPLGPVGAGNSPYAAFSAFAGEPLLLSLERLAEAGLLLPSELQEAPEGAPDRVDYAAVSARKHELLRRAHSRRQPTPAFEEFRAREAGWLGDYALYAALKERHGGEPWGAWPAELRARQPDALGRARAELSEEVGYREWLQYVFREQWSTLRREAGARGIRVIGDLPIFVALDSADVWTHPELFLLDERGEPTVVAGVPPDYFSATGQLWGNPLYRWDVLEREGYAWWVSRLRRALELYDIVRVDHFRGFESYWEIRAGESTAINGRWVKGPGAALFRRLREELGELPIIAEDLGIITPEVEQLRDELGLPGMKVLQFGFTAPDNWHLPHNHVPNSVVYTGTHDNDTTLGWWEAASEEERGFARRYLGRDLADPAWDLIRAALGSVAVLSVFPVQDVLGLGSEARMNVPGEPEGNWEWRLPPGSLTPELAARLRETTWLYGR